MKTLQLGSSIQHRLARPLCEHCLERAASHEIRTRVRVASIPKEVAFSLCKRCAREVFEALGQEEGG